jgi:hypothetical protein
MEWISVKDRMPEPETEVLVCVSKRDRKIITRAMYEDGTITTDDSDWFQCGETCLIGRGWFELACYNLNDITDRTIDDIVTHWMPLPKAPEED